MNGEPSFGAWLRRRRKALDLTQIELARQAGCSPESLRKVEADVLRPSKQLAELLAAALGVAPGERAAFVRFAREGEPVSADIPLPPVPQPAMLGRYRLLDRLGQGATAEVFKAFQPALDRYVAIKLLTTHLAQDAGFVAGFEREATAAARLRHPNIVQVHDFDIGAVGGRGTPCPYMVMEFIDGPTLKAQLEALLARGERLPLEECLRVVEALAGALDYAHARGMVHHDVKPANAMFTAERQVVLTDFGLVHLQDAVGRTPTGTTSGTPAYLSPEQAMGRRGDARSDVYSLGIVLFELVAGRVPFVDDDPAALVLKHVNEAPPSPRAIDPRVPEAVEQVILTALAKTPEARHQTAGALAQALRAALGVSAEAITPIRRAPAEPPACPYRGLFAFREEDAPFFFGRETFTERLVTAVEGQSEVRSPKSKVGGAGARLVAVIGPSGSGKSSVVYSGLLPTLRQAATLREAQGLGWLITDFRPGARPFHALAAALLPLLDESLSETDRLIEIHKLAHALEEGTFGLPAVIARILEKHPEAGRILLVVDQFEELYTLCPEPETQRRFVDVLLAALPGSPLPTAHCPLPTACCLLTLRADFMGQALAHRGLADALQDAVLILGPMNDDELRRAIESPAAKLGVAFEHGLVERILADVGHEPGNLPLLEFALAALWEHAADGLLTHEAYEAIGRVEGALARYAEEVFAQLSAAEQELARQAFVQMVRPGEGTEDTRRQAMRAEFGEDSWALARRLADARLVVTDRDAAGVETVEVVHEALLRSWARLREWMSADRRFRAWQERLRVELRQWEAAGRDEGALLRGAPLAEAEGWLAERAAELSEAERAFVTAAQELREREAAEREAGRQRELEAAKRLAETETQRAEVEQHRAQDQVQAAGALRRRARVLALALVAAALLGLIALYFGLQSNDASQRNAGLAHENAAAAATAQVANTAEVAQRAAAQAANTAEVAQRTTAQAAGTVAVAQRGTAQAASTVAVAQQVTAEANLVRADAQRLAAEANTLLLANGNADLIALLTLRSLNLQYSPQGDGALAAAAQLEYPVRVFGGSGRAALSPDNKYVLTGDFSDDRARLWDVQTGREVRQLILSATTPVVLPGAFSPDGKYALVGCFDGVVRLFDVQTGQEVRRLDLSGGSVNIYTSAFGEYSPDGKYVVTWKAPDNTVTLWDARTWQQTRTISVDSDQVLNDRSLDYKYVLTTGSGSAKLWDFQTGQVVRTFEHPLGIVFAILSPDGRYIATANLDNTAWLWDAQTGQVLRRFVGHEARVAILMFSPDGRYLLTGGSDDLTARLWDVQTGAQLRVFTGHSGSVWSVTFSVDGRYVLTGGDATFRMWDLQARPPLPQFVGHTSGIESAAFSPDGRYIATGSWDHTARLWDAHTGQSLQVFTGHAGVVNTGLAFSSDGRYLLTGGGDHTVRLWDVRTGQTVHVFTTAVVSADYGVNGVAFSPDGQYVLAGCGGVAQMWAFQTGQEVRRFTIPPGFVGGIYPVAFSPDGQYVLTGSDDGVRLWDPQTGQQTRLFQSSGAIYDARFAPDGRSILASSLGGNFIVLWDVQTGQELWRFNDIAPGLAVFSPDGQYVLAGLGDKTARLWDLGTGQEVRRFIGHTSGAYTVAFSPDGKSVFTGSEDMTGRLWDADYHTTMDYLCSVLLRDFTDDERVKYDITDTGPTCRKP